MSALISYIVLIALVRAPPCCPEIARWSISGIAGSLGPRARCLNTRRQVFDSAGGHNGGPSSLPGGLQRATPAPGRLADEDILRSLHTALPPPLLLNIPAVVTREEPLDWHKKALFGCPVDRNAAFVGPTLEQLLRQDEGDQKSALNEAAL